MSHIGTPLYRPDSFGAWHLQATLVGKATDEDDTIRRKQVLAQAFGALPFEVRAAVSAWCTR